MLTVLALSLSLVAGTPTNASSGTSQKPSLREAEARREIEALDAMERENKRKREVIARIREQEDRRAQNDRNLMIVVLVIAGIAVLFYERRRRARTTRS